MTKKQKEIFKNDFNSRMGEVVDGKSFKEVVDKTNFHKIIDYYNQQSDVEVWRSFVTLDELNSCLVASEFLQMDPSHQNAYQAMFKDRIDATNPQVRANIAEVFKDCPQTALNIFATCKRLATRFEALFTKDNMSEVFGYQLGFEDIKEATQ